MKILAIGDTHGKLNRVRDIFTKLKNIDLIIHTGDYIEDAARIEKEFGIPVAAVKGNCDGSCSRDDFTVVETECGSIFVTHGHMYNVSYQLGNIMYKALEENCRAVVFGHTHRALMDEDDGFYFINPGSLTSPRDNSGGSYAVIRTSEDSFEASVVYYDTVMGTGSKKTKSGYIKGLLNYSDRF